MPWFCRGGNEALVIEHPLGPDTRFYREIVAVWSSGPWWGSPAAAVVVLGRKEVPLTSYCLALSLVSVLRKIRYTHQNVASLEFFIENTTLMKAGVWALKSTVGIGQWIQFQSRSSLYPWQWRQLFSHPLFMNLINCVTCVQNDVLSILCWKIWGKLILTVMYKYINMKCLNFI